MREPYVEEEGETLLFPFGSNVFEWNGRKAAANFTKHGILFTDAARIFEDDDGLLRRDEKHS